MVAYLPTNLCYPKVIDTSLDIPWLLISGHKSCDIDSNFTFHAFHYLAFITRHITDLPMDNFWNPMLEIIDDKICVFGGLERVKNKNGSLELTGNVLNDIWYSDSLYSLLKVQFVDITSIETTDTNHPCDDYYYDGYITAPMEIIHSCNDTILVDLIIELLDVIKVIYNDNGIIDVYVTQNVANKQYRLCGNSFINVITCFHEQDAENILNVTTSPEFPAEIVHYLNKTITVYVHVKNITVVYINNFESTETIYDIVEDDTKCTGSGSYNYYIFIILICIAVFFSVLIVIDLCHTMINSEYYCECCGQCGCYASDAHHTQLLAIIMLRICDMLTDIFLSTEILFRYIECFQDNPFNLLFVLSLSSIACIAIPWIINVLTMIKITKLPNVVIERPTIWFKKYMLFYVFLVVITGDCYTSTMLISSNLFALSIFDSGLNIIQYGSVRYTKVTTIIFEV